MRASSKRRLISPPYFAASPATRSSASGSVGGLTRRSSRPIPPRSEGGSSRRSSGSGAEPVHAALRGVPCTGAGTSGAEAHHGGDPGAQRRPTRSAASSRRSRLRTTTARGRSWSWTTVPTTARVEIARTWTDEQPNARLVRAPDVRGAAHARNRGVAAAEGDFIAFCDADDVVTPRVAHRIDSSGDSRGSRGGQPLRSSAQRGGGPQLARGAVAARASGRARLPALRERRQLRHLDGGVRPAGGTRRAAERPVRTSICPGERSWPGIDWASPRER